LASISCSDAAAELLRRCVAGDKWDSDLVSVLTADHCSDALFRILVEGLADRFEPRLCDAYADIFCRILETCTPDLEAKDLRARYERVREPRLCNVNAENVVVLSRVTLGADIAVASVILNALKLRFPDAKIYFAGNDKAAELFGDDSRVIHLNTQYTRSGIIRDRLTSWKHLAASMPSGKTIVVDPDSRLTQLGLLPLGDESDYFFFESRAYGGDRNASLSELAAQWTSETFEVTASQPRIFPRVEHFVIRGPSVAVSLGTGGNDLKALPEQFEKDLIALLCSRFADVVVDEGFGPAESERVAHAIDGTTARTFRGSFAQFASVIAKSSCYVGYDSAGQHAAAAFGTPLLTLFKGFASDRMFARWQPAGPGPKQVLKLSGTPSIEEIRASLDILTQDALIQTV
jgi:ADP-heptose:LPS heptosyltransferase